MLEGDADKEDRARLFSVVPKKRTGGKGPKLRYEKLHLITRELSYCTGG